VITVDDTDPVLLTMGLHVPVQTKQRARSGNGHWYTPEATQAFEESARWEMKLSRIKPIPTDGLRLDVNFFLPSKKVARRADLDNYLKSLMDAGNGFAWVDDKQIIEAHMWLRLKRDADPFITFSVQIGEYAEELIDAK